MKFMRYTLALAFALSLCACGVKRDLKLPPEEKQEKQAEQVEQPQEERE